MTAAEEVLSYLNEQIALAAAQREEKIRRTREFWDGKKRTMLADRLREIEVEKHWAEWTLIVAPLRAERETVIDAISQIEMAKPMTVITQ